MITFQQITYENSFATNKTESNDSPDNGRILSSTKYEDFHTECRW